MNDTLTRLQTLLTTDLSDARRALVTKVTEALQKHIANGDKAMTMLAEFHGWVVLDDKDAYWGDGEPHYSEAHITWVRGGSR